MGAIATFRELNALVEGAVLKGCGSPAGGHGGLIVLETRGRVSGLPRRVPLLATLVQEHAIVATIRTGRSDWMKNLRRNPAARYWLGGEERSVRAVVILPGETPDTAVLPGPLRGVAACLQTTAAVSGLSFAVLAPAG